MKVTGKGIKNKQVDLRNLEAPIKVNSASDYHALLELLKYRYVSVGDLPYYPTKLPIYVGIDKKYQTIFTYVEINEYLDFINDLDSEVIDSEAEVKEEEEVKEEVKEEEENNIEKGNNKMEKNTLELLKMLDGYTVKGERYTVTPNGLSICGKTFSKREGALLETVGTEIVSDLPVGFNIPTVVKDIAIGDIVLYGETPYYVKKKSTDDGRTIINGISPETGLEVIIVPTLDLLGNQVFNKVFTPFDKIDIGCNPIVNVTTMSALAYAKGGQEEVIKQITPYIIKLATRRDLVAKVFNDNRFKTFAPIIYVGMIWAKKENLSLKEIPEKLKIEVLSSKLKELDKKKLTLVLLLIALIVVLNKDKISEKLIEYKVKEVPVIGKFANPIARILNKIPSFKRKALFETFDENKGE